MYGFIWNIKKSILVIMLLIIIPASHAAKVHGTLYAWSDFEKPLRNVIVEVNSTPVQAVVAADGTYSFDLPAGNYMITAKYYRNNVLVYSAEEEIKIDREGNFTIDILLFPPTDSEYEFLGDINLTNIDIKNEDNNYVILTFLILIFPAIVVYWFLKKASC